MGVAVVFTYYVDGDPRPQAVIDGEGRVRVWHDRADRYGWADLFVTWDGDLPPSQLVAPDRAEAPAGVGGSSAPTGGWL